MWFEKNTVKCAICVSEKEQVILSFNVEKCQVAFPEFSV